MEIVKDVFRTVQEQGIRLGGARLADYVSEDARVHLYSTAGRVLEGPEEVREYFAEVERAGTQVILRPQVFEEDGDAVTVVGSVRIQRAQGGFAETQIRWTWRFRDDLIVSTTWEPSAGV